MSLGNIIKAFTNKEVNTVVFGFLKARFTPNDINNYYVNLLKEDDTILFVMKDKSDLFQNNKLMFPILSHA